MAVDMRDRVEAAWPEERRGRFGEGMELDLVKDSSSVQ